MTAARILDRGYRKYTGERRGVRGAVVTLWFHSLQRALGLRRSTWAKVLPVGVILVSYVPAIVFIGIVSFIPERDLSADFALPTYGTYFTFIISAMALFVAFVGPEILCTDRRTGMLGLYLASPLTRDSYLVAKALATATVLAFVTIGPPLLMLVAFIIQSEGPDGPLGVVVALLRILGSGLAITTVYTAFSLGVASLTDRKAFATAGLILFFFMTNVIDHVLTGPLGGSQDLMAVNIFTFPIALVEKIHGESENFADVHVAPLVLAAVAWTLIWAAICRARYQKLMVTK